jgi:hypothetical protein
MPCIKNFDNECQKQKRHVSPGLFGNALVPFTFGTIMFLGSFVCGQVDDSILEKVRSCWELDEPRCFEMTVRTEGLENGIKIDNAFQFCFFRLGEFMRYEYSNRSNELHQPHSVVCTNPTYNFRLVRSDGNNEYVIEHIDSSQDSQIVELCRRMKRAPQFVILGNRDLRSLLFSASSKVHSAKLNSLGLIEINFENTTVELTSDLLPVRSAYLVVQSESPYLPVSLKAEIPAAGNPTSREMDLYTVAYSYELTTEGRPFKVMIEETTVLPTGELIKTMKTIKYHLSPGNEFDYTLSAYGINEPPHLRTNNRPRWEFWLVLIVLAMVAVLVGTKFRQYVR